MTTYAKRISERAARDPRITVAAPVTRGALATELERYDVLAIPSRWLETGPLVALEARAAGRPVAASRRGGLAEIVREPEDGWLLAAGRRRARGRRSSRDSPTIRPLRAVCTVRPIRQMRDVCDEMMGVYEMWWAALAHDRESSAH